MTEEPDDQYYVAQVRSGAVEAFDVLVTRHRTYVCRIVVKHLSREYVEEVAQEVFIEAYQSLHTFRATGTFRSWLATIALRTCYTHLRRKYRNREVAVSQLTEQGEDWCRDLMCDAATDLFNEGERRKQAAEVLEWSMRKLSPEDRMVITLIHLEERSVRDVARDLGWSSAKVKIRAFRARKALKELFDAFTETGQKETGGT